MTGIEGGNLHIRGGASVTHASDAIVFASQAGIFRDDELGDTVSVSPPSEPADQQNLRNVRPHGLSHRTGGCQMSSVSPSAAAITSAGTRPLSDAVIASTSSSVRVGAWWNSTNCRTPASRASATA